MGCGSSKEAVQQQQEPTPTPPRPPPSKKPSTPPPPTQPSTTPTVPGGGAPTAIYKYLPKNAEKFSVRNVYDGDTLTLVDERRVRLLGIDTPELAEKQPYAQEAKDYTKLHCYQRSVWLVIDGEDHYGRVLAHVFVPSDEHKGFYLCINEGLVEKGFAYTYIPSKDKQTFNWDKLIKLQTQARKAKRGLWSNFKDNVTVHVTLNGAAYHQDKGCQHLQKVKHLKEMKVSAAMDQGLHPCRTCTTG
ncbi:hypothetical protein ACA910_006042 [Epithemia clementina (nom. ined.)]